MNKLLKLIVFGIVAAACASPVSASMLYWQVIDAPDRTLSTLKTDYTKGGSGNIVEDRAQIDSARLVAKSASGAITVLTTQYDENRQHVGWYDQTGVGLSDSGDMEAALFADLSVLENDGMGYAFAIELGHYNAGSWTTLADSSYFSYDYLLAHNIYKGGTDTPPDFAWTPSAYAAPEPTSALLFLTGLSLMALRRRKVV